MHFTEDDFENAILELFREQLGYDYVYGPNVIRDYAEPLYVEVLEAVLPQINRGLPQAAIDEAMVKIRTYEGGTLVQKNELFTDYLQNGVAVNYFDGRISSERWAPGRCKTSGPKWQSNRPVR